MQKVILSKSGQWTRLHNVADEGHVRADELACGCWQSNIKSTDATGMARLVAM